MGVCIHFWGNRYFIMISMCSESPKRKHMPKLSSWNSNAIHNRHHESDYEHDQGLSLTVYFLLHSTAGACPRMKLATLLVLPLSERASLLFKGTRYVEQWADVQALPFMNSAWAGGWFGIWCGVGVVLVMHGLRAAVPTPAPTDSC